MPAENIGRWQLLGHPFLTGVDDLEAGRHGGNLGYVTRLDRVAKNKALSAGGRWRLGRSCHNIGCCQSHCLSQEQAAYSVASCR
jgi:hypothetical protein